MSERVKFFKYQELNRQKYCGIGGLNSKVFAKEEKPTTSRSMFTIVENILAESGVIFAKTTAAPVTPPKVKLFGNLK